MSTPHFAVPLRLDRTGRFATVEQDSPDEIAQCVAACLATPEGSRVEAPDYGSPRTDFHVGNLADLVAAVAEWEPRADIDVTVVEGLGSSTTAVDIAVAVKPHL